MKAQLGHDGEPQGFWDVNLITDEKLTRCPIRLLQLAKSELRDEVLRWKDLYFPLYMKGHLLVDGAIADQPARWLAAMQYLEALQSKMESKYVELHKAEDAE